LLKKTVAALVAICVAGFGGWGLGRSGFGLAPAEAPPAALQRRRAPLETKLAKGEATAEEQLQLLKLRLALGDQNGAISLLEPLSDQRPEQWKLRLMLADLRRQQKDQGGAEREIRQVLNVQPLQVEAWQQLTQLQLKQGKGAKVEAQLNKAAVAAKGKPEELTLGLLLADLQQRRQQKQSAENTYRNLINRYPEDPRPLLAMALQKQEAGQGEAAVALLREARQRMPENSQLVLDQVAAGWSMKNLQKAAQGPTGNTLRAGAAGLSN
jgi:tetratricopeptide (TPR) repeat protein